MQRFRDGLVFKAHRLLYHSTLGLRVIKKKKYLAGALKQPHARRDLLCCQHLDREREFIIDNLLVRIHFTIVMIRWTGLAPWEPEFPFPGSLTSTFLARHDLLCGQHLDKHGGLGCRV